MSRRPAGLTGDDRAVTAVIGFILIFGILVVTFTIYQAEVVPQQNSDVEFEHYQDIREDMAELRTAHVNTVESGQQRSTSLALGSLYPSRLVAVNPPPPTGTLRSESVGTIELDVGGDAYDLAGLCGTTPETDAIRYQPAYNELADYEAAPIVYENTVVYRTPGRDSVPLADTDQLILSGTSINLVPLQTDISDTGLSTSVTFASDSFGPERTVGENTTVELRLPTLAPELWRDELLDDVGTVQSVSTGTESVTVGLQAPPGEELTVRCAAATNGDDIPVSPPQNGVGIEGTEQVDVGLGGTTTFRTGLREDTFVAPNGQWLDIPAVDGIELFDARPARLTGSQNSGFRGEVSRVTFELRGGVSEDRIVTEVRLERDPETGDFQTRVVKLSDDSGSAADRELTTEAASAIYDGGVTDILNETNYVGSFGSGPGTFGGFVGTVERMENATWQTAATVGRTDIRIETGDTNNGSVSVVATASADDIDAGKNNEKQEVTFELDETLQAGDELVIDLSGVDSGVQYSDNKGDWQVRSNSDASGRVDRVRTAAGTAEAVVYRAGANDNAGDTLAVRGQNIDTNGVTAGTSEDLSVYVGSAADFADGPQDGDRAGATFQIS